MSSMLQWSSPIRQVPCGGRVHHQNQSLAVEVSGKHIHFQLSLTRMHTHLVFQDADTGDIDQYGQKYGTSVMCCDK